MIIPKARKARKMLDFLINDHKDIEIFGMFGPGNLGDEAMLVAALENLPKGRGIAWQAQPNRPLLNNLFLRRRRPHLLVAGGTLIHGGVTDWLDFVEHRTNQGAMVSFFGTGVAFTDNQIAYRSGAFERWARLMERAENIFLRGPASVDIVSKMGARADVFGDFAFLLYDPKLVIRDHNQRSQTIGFNFGRCLADQEAFEAQCITLIKTLAPKYHLVFHVVVKSDLEVTKRIITGARLADSSFSIEFHYFDPVAFMRSIRGYQAFIGLKLHAAGLAMVAGVPALMVAYRAKARDFMAPIGGREDLLVDLPLDTEEILHKLNKILDDPQGAVVTTQIAKLSQAQKLKLQEAYGT